MKMVELRRLESGVMMRWRRRVEEVARKLEAGARLKRRDPDLAAEVVRKVRSGKQPVRPVLKRGRRGRRQPHLHRTEEVVEEMVIAVAVDKALEVSGRERGEEVELLLEGQLLEVRRSRKAPQSPSGLVQALTTLT